MSKTIEELLQAPYWILDILPRQVPADSPGQFFAVERYYLQPKRLKKIKKRHLGLILKLNCYRSVSLDEEAALDPPPEQIEEAVLRRSCFIRIGDAGILSEPDDTHMTLFGPDEELLELVRTLAAGEGLYLWQPETPPEGEM